MDEKKMKLIQGLKNERERFIKYGNNVDEHDIVISYLETGKTDKSPDDYGLLDVVMNDYETTCKDYSN